MRQLAAAFLSANTLKIARLDAALQLRHYRMVVNRCSQCGTAMTCQPDGGCWCADLPHCVPMPGTEDQGEACLCRTCLLAKMEGLKESAEAKET